MPHTGSCLCGETTVTVNKTFDNQTLCHCLDCRRTSGSAFSTNIVAPINETKIEGMGGIDVVVSYANTGNVGPFKEFKIKAASGNTVTRVFCGNCGAAIAHKSVAFGDAQAIQTGILPDFASIAIKTELFTKDRWSVIAPVAGAAQVSAMS